MSLTKNRDFGGFFFSQRAYIPLVLLPFSPHHLRTSFVRLLRPRYNGTRGFQQLKTQMMVQRTFATLLHLGMKRLILQLQTFHNIHDPKHAQPEVVILQLQTFDSI